LIKNDCINKFFIEKNSIKVLNLLKRIKNTKPQACLSKIDRLTNLDSAFCIYKKYPKIKNDSIFIIVDDISTT
jgi:predicted amidophosphoribosyltransferase